jgi:putative two-component system response regulator
MFWILPRPRNRAMHKRDFLDAKILVVDDEVENVRLVSNLLAFGGFTDVVSETNSAKAVDSFQKVQPDLVILDFKMSPLDGLQVLGQIEPLVPAGSYLPVLMLTGEISREVKEGALAAGAMDFLSKPFQATELLLRVKNLLHTRLLHIELQHERDLLDERVQERTAEVTEARNEILERLAMLGEFRDEDTSDHTRRVGQMVRDIALKFGLDEEVADLFGKAALLHDIGKSGVPDEILRKPGPLTTDEFSLIKKHAFMGGEILKGSKSELLQRAEIIARYHHEHWNGSGYEGLAGEAIPIEARITAIADVFDALIGERPYKQAWSREDAIAEIDRLAGQQFDPFLVAAFHLVLAELPLSEAA